jgi:hypothetical protein
VSTHILERPSRRTPILAILYARSQPPELPPEYSNVCACDTEKSNTYSTARDGSLSCRRRLLGKDGARRISSPREISHGLPPVENPFFPQNSAGVFSVSHLQGCQPSEGDDRAPWQLAVFRVARRWKGDAHLAGVAEAELKRFLQDTRGTEGGHDEPLLKAIPFRKLWAEFQSAWAGVIWPAGHGPLDLAMRQAADRPAAWAKHLGRACFGDTCRRLAQLCEVLQLRATAAGRPAFFLGVRAAAEVLGVDRMTAWRALKRLESTGRLQCVCKGSKGKRLASEWILNLSEGEK